ncbi:MAG: thermonuclease family protein [Planctomycetaceae bacterium]
MAHQQRAFRLRRRLHAPGLWAFLLLLGLVANHFYWQSAAESPRSAAPRSSNVATGDSSSGLATSTERSQSDDISPDSTNLPDGIDPPRRAVVKRVVDGDTLLLDTGERVRLIGVNTPETKHPDLPVDPLGLEAAEFVVRRVQGKSIELRFDREKVDQHQRLLAYVYVDNQFLNEELIREGYSKVVTRFPYSSSQKAIFILAEEEAKKAKRRIWDRAKR